MSTPIANLSICHASESWHPAKGNTASQTRRAGCQIKFGMTGGEVGVRLDGLMGIDRTGCQLTLA